MELQIEEDGPAAGATVATASAPDSMKSSRPILSVSRRASRIGERQRSPLVEVRGVDRDDEHSGVQVWSEDTEQSGSPAVHLHLGPVGFGAGPPAFTRTVAVGIAVAAGWLVFSACDGLLFFAAICCSSASRSSGVVAFLSLRSSSSLSELSELSCASRAFCLSIWPLMTTPPPTRPMTSVTPMPPRSPRGASSTCPALSSASWRSCSCWWRHLLDASGVLRLEAGLLDLGVANGLEAWRLLLARALLFDAVASRRRRACALLLLHVPGAPRRRERAQRLPRHGAWNLPLA